MKLQADYSEITSWSVSQTLMGKLLNLSQQRINQLIDEGVMVRDEFSKQSAVMLIESLKNFYQSRAYSEDDGDSVNFWKERALNEKAKRELNELKLAKERDELYDAATVENACVEVAGNFRNKVLSLASKMAAALAGKSAEQINAALTTELEDVLTDLSEGFTNADFVEGESDEEPDATFEDDTGGG